MKLLFISALLIVWASPMTSTQSKTVIRIKQEAIQYACQTQKRSLQDAFGLITIPSVIEKKQVDLFANGGLLGMGKAILGNALELAGIKISNVQLPEIDVNFVPHVGLQVSVNTNIDISCNLFLVGDIVIKVGASVKADLKVTRTTKGLPIVEISTCKCGMGSFRIQTPGWGVLPSVHDIIKGHLQAILSDKLCVSVSNIFLGVNGNLAMLVGVKAIDDHLGMQYIMPSPPVVNKDYMDMDMNVQYTVHEKVVEIPTGSKEFILPPGAGNQNSMVNMGFSQDFFSSMFTAFQNSEGFNMEIASNFASLGNYLRTSALGAHIPEISRKYPQSLPVQLNIVLSQTPIVILKSGQLLVEFAPYVEFFALLPNLRVQHLITVNVGANLIAKLNVRGGKLQASLSLQGGLKLVLASSSLRNCGCDPSVLQGYMRAVFERAYLLHINGKMDAGITLPTMHNLKFSNEAMEVKDDYAVMSCDLQYAN